MNRAYLPNAWQLGKTYHVARQHAVASDENPGTEERPFKTISAAAKAAREFDRVVIDEGIYREQVPIVRDGNRGVPRSWVIFEAAPGKEVYLKGSDEFDTDWEELEKGIHKAPLPRSLFEPGAYNPYALDCVPTSCPANYEFDRGGYLPGEPGEQLAEREKVRPAAGEALPETLGQIYVDHEPLEQLDSVQAVRETPGSFVVSADGREIICHFVGGEAPRDRLVELTVRERCFKPRFTPHWSGLMIQTLGIVVEHAADPGAFSRCRPLFIRRNPRSGITIRKTMHARCGVSGSYVRGSNFSCLSPDRPAMLSSVMDGARPVPPGEQRAVPVVSDDGFKTWAPLEDGPLTDPIADYFLDEENGMLLRHYRTRADGVVYNDKTVEQHEAQKLVLQGSPDAGRTWGPAEELAFGNDIVCFTLMKLQDGKLFWIIEENRPELSGLRGIKPDAIFFVCRSWRGTWRPDRSGVDWEQGGLIQIPHEMGSQGVGEPQACQLPDGRIVVILRQSIVLPGQDSPGYPLVKLISVSDDGGKSWSEAKPLTFDDGKYAYSSTSFASCFRSSKNGRVYVILNILNGPNEGCLPRNVLHLAEIDQNTLAIKRETVTVVEEVHEEHTHVVGYSNWAQFEDRESKNLVLFMNLENGPVNEGYDWNAYRYEIALPGGEA